MFENKLGTDQKYYKDLGLACLGLRFSPFLISLEGLLGESRGIAPLLSVYLGTRWGWVVNTTPRPLCPRERPGTHCTGGWVGLGAGLDRCGKPRPHRDSIPGPSSPVASRYTDYVNKALKGVICETTKKKEFNDCVAI
jgi:hypothetical protein